MKNFGLLGVLFAGIGVAAGAFGAHALKTRLEPSLLAVFETGVRYQLVHALALIALWLAESRGSRRPLVAAGVLFTVGILLFSGSLYALALSGVRIWGAVTPFGGLCFLAGWVAFALGIRGANRSADER